MKNNTKIHITYLRVLACFLVVLVHVSAEQLNYFSPRTFEWQVLNTFNCIAIFGVPLFVMISGTLLLSSKKEHLISYTLKKALNLFLIYYAFIFACNFYTYFKGCTTFSFEQFKHSVLVNTLLSIGTGFRHLWFLPMIAVLYLATPFLKELVRNKKLLTYYLVLYFVFSLFFPTIFRYDFRYKSIISALYDSIPFMTFESYLGYFLLGYYLETYSASIKNKTKYLLYMLSFVSILCVIILCGMDAYQTNTHSIIMNTPFSIFHFIGCSGIYLFFKSRFEYIQKPMILFTKISNVSLGIYLTHIAFINVLTYLNIQFVAPLQAICVFTISGLFCALFQLLKFKKK